MLNYLAPLYEDELWSSCLSRTFRYGGIVASKRFSKLIFSGKQECLNSVFVNSYKREFKKLIKEVYGPKTILKHTLIPFYTITLGDDKQNIYSRALRFDRSINKSLAVPKSNDCHLKYCDECVKQDKQKYGEAYWHLSHQITNYCQKHRCKLLVSDIQYAKSKIYSLLPEPNPSTNQIERKEQDDINIVFETYLLKAMESNNVSKGFPISNYLRSIIPEKYFRDKTMERINSIKLLKDVKQRFQGLDGIDGLTEYRIRSLFNSTQINVRDYLLLTFFFGVSARDAVVAKPCHRTNHFVERVISLRNRNKSINSISRLLNTDKRIVRRIIRTYYQS